jgi:hypothetical protein
MRSRALLPGHYHMLNDRDKVLSKIRSAMKVEEFKPPAAAELIDDVERGLRVSFPSWLREVYLACNGFTGPTGVRYLYPLDGSGGVLDLTLFLREEWWPDWLDRSIIFSDNGLGGSITTHWGVLDGRLIEWCYGDVDEYSILDLDIYELWAREQEGWNELDEPRS